MLRPCSALDAQVLTQVPVLLMVRLYLHAGRFWRPESVTLVEAIKSVLKENPHPMNVDQIYAEIASARLYKFKEKNPRSVLTQTIREHSNANSKARVVLFNVVGLGLYTLA